MIYISLFVIGSLSGGLLVHKVGKKKETPPPVVITPPPDEISKEITNIELLEIPCSEEFISKYSDGLCREMFCLMNIRGEESETSGSQCEQISNVNNSITMLKYCTPSIPENVSEEELQKITKYRDECLRTFRERK